MKILTEKELCELLKVESVFLWKCRKNGMPYLRLGSKLIRYNLDDVLAWFESQNQNVAGGAA